jgi:hypothetical protein
MLNLAGMAGKASSWVLVSVRWVVVAVVTIVLLSLSVVPIWGVIGLVVYQLFRWLVPWWVTVYIIMPVLLYVLVLIYLKTGWRARRSIVPRSAMNLPKTDREEQRRDAARLTSPQVIGLAALWIGGGFLLLYASGSLSLEEIAAVIGFLFLLLYPLIAFWSICRRW